MTDEISLRDLRDSDLPIFFAHQLDREAIRMAAFPPRDREAFMAHWAKIKADGTTIVQTILFRDQVAGNIVCWEDAGERKVGYWVGKEYWGQGIATAALSQFLMQLKTRPLHAHVAKHNVGSIRVLQKCGFTIAGEAKFAGLDGEPGEEWILILGANDHDKSE